MTDHHAALVQHFLNIPVAQRETVIQPDSVLNDGHGKAVAVGIDVRHRQSTYPEPVKATQPFLHVPVAEREAVIQPNRMLDDTD